MDVQWILKSVDRFGIPSTVHQVAYEVANKVTRVIILRGIKLTLASVDPRLVASDAGLRWGFLERDALVGALPQGACEDMDERFIDQALSRGDVCYGAFDGPILASYGWYSTRPTPISDDLILHFDPSWAYVYKGYTLPAYRGQRLHGIGMGRALAAQAGGASSGLVAYVKSSNHASLRSCYRLGYQNFGQIFVLKAGGQYLTYATRGCAAYGFRVEPVSTA